MNDRFSIAGVLPERVLVPGDCTELASMVRDLYAANRAFAFVGGGTELDLGNAPRALDTIVRTVKLDRVVDYSPEDQTITVEAGMRIAALDAELARHDQMLPLDVADRANATVGGAIATNAFGARRHRYGSIKDLIVGIEIVRPDGVRARGGGKVVKNVAGFDVPKLMVGALGTLGGILTATFRVFPKAAVERTVFVRTAPGEALYRSIVADRSLEPQTLVVHPDAHGIVMTFAAIAPSVDAQIAHLMQLAGDACRELDEAASAAFVARETAVRREGAWRWTTMASPAAATAAPALSVLHEIGYPTLGIRLYAAADAIAADTLVKPPGGSLVYHAMPQRFRGRLDAWGEPPPAFGLMRALKLQFDPKGLCNPGRFIGGL